MNSIVSLALLFALVLCAPLASCQALTAGLNVLATFNTTHWNFNGAPIPKNNLGFTNGAGNSVSIQVTDLEGFGIAIDAGILRFDNNGVANIGALDFGAASVYFGPFSFTQSAGASIDATNIGGPAAAFLEFQGASFVNSDTSTHFNLLAQYSRVTINNSYIEVGESQFILAAPLLEVLGSSLKFNTIGGTWDISAFGTNSGETLDVLRFRNSVITGSGNTAGVTFSIIPGRAGEFTNVTFGQFASVSINAASSTAVANTSLIINGIRTSTGRPSLFIEVGSAGSTTNTNPPLVAIADINVQVNAFSLAFSTQGQTVAYTPYTVTGLVVDALIKDTVKSNVILVDDVLNTVSFPSASITSAEEIVIRGAGTLVFTNANVVSTAASGAGITFADIINLSFTNSRAIAATGAISITPVP